MIRRSHRKSKQGCIQCKRSHKKCDESYPSCANCTISKKCCSYTDTRNDGSQLLDDNFIITTGPEILIESQRSNSSIVPKSSTATSELTVSVPVPTNLMVEPVPYVNLLHLELFNNVTGNGINFFEESKNDEWQNTLMRYMFSYPYLIYEVLALSAFHKSITNPTLSSLYLNESTHLQSLALNSFNNTTPTSTQESLNASFLFSAVLGLHFFSSIFSKPSPDLPTFLSHLVQSLHLLRGVRATIGDSWSLIRDSDISCLLYPEIEPVSNPQDPITRAFTFLLESFPRVPIPPSEREIYLEAIAKLQWAYNSSHSDNTTRSKIQPRSRMVVAWPITLSAEYASLLAEQKPEALVILAYFSILLHRKRDFWAVGDAGRLLFGAIDRFLEEDRKWEEWLEVPRKMVMGSD